MWTKVDRSVVGDQFLLWNLHGNSSVLHVLDLRLLDLAQRFFITSVFMDISMALQVTFFVPFSDSLRKR